MCELYYLDQYRAELNAKETENAIDVDAAEELMQEAKVSMKAMSERTAKLALDLAFIQIRAIYDNDAAQERLIRYGVELCRKAKFDFDDRQNFYETLRDHIESHIGDD